MLPRQYEAHRAEIEAILPPIHLPVPASAATLITSATGPEDVSGDALGFIHRYVPPAAGAELASSTTLLLLVGRGGDEEALIPLGRGLLRGAGLLSPRGKVLARGAPRFFRRIAEGVFDQEDLARRTDELAQFIEAAAKTYDLDLQGIVAAGFSNGANIAASLLLRRPGLVRGAVSLSPIDPFESDTLPHLTGTCAFLGAGAADSLAPPAQAERLGDLGDLLSAVERFEAVVEAHGGDLMVDDLKSSQPDDSHFVVPRRGHGETVRAYVVRIDEAAARLRGHPRKPD